MQQRFELSVVVLRNRLLGFLPCFLIRPLSKRLMCTLICALLLLGAYLIHRNNRETPNLLFLPSSAVATARKTTHDAFQASKEVGNAAEGARNETTSVQRPAEEIQSTAHIQKRYLVYRFQGRLGNVLFQIAAATCIAALNNLTLVANKLNSLRELLHQVPAVPSVPLSPVKHHDEAYGCAFYPSLMKLEPTDSHHAVGGYFQTWRYFEPCKTQVKRTILFTDSVISKAVSIVTNLREKLPHRTLVGVHVRMGDYLLPSEIKVGRKTAPPEYYHRAMGYFRSRFRNVTFVVMASSPSWFRNVSSSEDVLMLERSPSAAVDMEVLSRMDHLIFSVGTFGWWAGYKSNGTVIAYRDFYVLDSVYGHKMSNCVEFFFYPGWILM